MTRSGRVVIVGGGLAGLVTAYRLTSEGDTPPLTDVLVLEREGTVGGRLRTEVEDGFVLEAGADSFIDTDGAVAALASALGIDAELMEPRPTAVRAYLRAGGRLHPLLGNEGSPVTRPASLLSSSLASPWAKARLLAEPLVPRRATTEDESVEAFLIRRLGRRAYEEVFEPLLAGVHGAEPCELSAAATLPRLVDEEKQGHSILGLGRREAANGGPRPSSLRTFRAGMRTLPDALRRAVGESRVRTGVRVVGVRPLGAHGRDGWEIETAAGDVERAQAVLLAVPAEAGAALLTATPGLAERLASFPTGVTAVVNLGYPAAAVGRALDAHGYMNRRREGAPVSACTWSSAKFDGRAPSGHVLLRGFVRGGNVPPPAPGRDQELVRLVRAELADSLGICQEPLWGRVDCWRVPVYAVGHPQRVAATRERLPRGLLLAGASYDGVGLEAVVRSAGSAAREVRTLLSGRAGV